MNIRAPRGVPVVFRWDLDKTYLRTDFDGVRDLVRTALQDADEKRAVPGATTLLRALCTDNHARITFVSGSPKQMREVLEEKLRIDGIEPDRLILKPNLENALRGRFRAIKGQIPYKLPALLEQRAMVPKESPEVCFGDDAEQDAFIYRLYGDVVAGVVGPERLEKILVLGGAYADQIERTLREAKAIASRAHGHDPVRRVFIHLDRRSPPARFDRYGPRVVPVFNYFQAALVLVDDGLLAAEHALSLTTHLMRSHGFAWERLANSLQDLVRRGALSVQTVRSLFSKAQTKSPPPLAQEFAERFLRRLDYLDESALPAPPKELPVDYEGILQEGELHRAS